MTILNRDINRAKTFSNKIHIIWPFLRKHSDVLFSAYDIHSFISNARERENCQKLKKCVTCTAKADIPYVNLL